MIELDCSASQNVSMCWINWGTACLEQNSEEIKRLFSAHQKVNYTVCGWIITIISYLVVLFTLPLSAFFCLKVSTTDNFSKKNN